MEQFCTPIHPISTSSKPAVESSDLHLVAIFGNDYQTANGQFVALLVETFRNYGVAVEIEDGFAEFLLSHEAIRPVSLIGVKRFSEVPVGADMALSMGGDGTFLNTAEKIGNAEIPILGINTGHLGFLADVTTDGIQEAVSQLVEGRYVISERSVIAVDVDSPELSTYPFALNEVAILKHDISSLIKIETIVNGEPLTNYVADGLVISTPTGSTGYSLSAGGPVLAPDSSTFCLAPVAPHSLTMRPVVLSDSVKLRLTVKSRSGNFLISVDGRSQSVPEETIIHIRKADYKVHVVKMSGNSFFHTLRNKMMWGLDQRC